MRNIKNILSGFSLRFLFVSLLISCGFFSPANAAVTVTSISGASYYSGTEITDFFVIYGAAIGDADNTACKKPLSSSEFCDNCKDSITGCSQYRIHPDLRLVITIKTDKTEATTNARGLIFFGTTALDIIGTVSGSEATFDIPWSQICEKMGSLADCSVSKNSQSDFKIGFDANSDGTLDDELKLQFRVVKPVGGTHADCIALAPEDIPANEGLCSFQVLPGDTKFRITDAAVNVTSYPSTGVADTNWRAVRFFYKAYDLPTTSAPDFADFGPGSSGVLSQERILKVSGTGTSKEVYFDPGENYIEDNLENGKFYCVRAASVDMAGNIYQFSSDIFLTTHNDLTQGIADFSKKQWRFCGTPDEVVGLLKNQGCFIATATYGSPIAPQVKLLREFRNKYLLPYSFGRKVVHFYYQHSPRIAYFIQASPLLKTISWIALTPVIGIVAIWMSDYFFLVLFLLFAIVATTCWVVIYKPKTRLL